MVSSEKGGKVGGKTSKRKNSVTQNGSRQTLTKTWWPVNRPAKEKKTAADLGRPMTIVGP